MDQLTKQQLSALTKRQRSTLAAGKRHNFQFHVPFQLKGSALNGFCAECRHESAPTLERFKAPAETCTADRCRFTKPPSGPKHTTASFTADITAEGYTVGESFQYLGYDRKHVIICPNGHTQNYTLQQWYRNGIRCRVCSPTSSRGLNFATLIKRYTDNGCTPEITQDRFMNHGGQNQPIVYTCSAGHTTESLTGQAFWQRIREARGPCKECAKATRKTPTKRQTEPETVARLSETIANHGGELLEVLPGRRVVYKCQCGNHARSNTSMILGKWSGTCRVCCNTVNGNKHTLESATEIFTAAGATMVEDQQYTNSSTRMAVVCQWCGNTTQRSIKDINRGRLCGNSYCAESRRIVTNMARYSVPNVSQLQEFKDKAVATNLGKYGVKHHMMVSEIRQRAAATNLERHGLEYSFRNEESIAAGRATCENKYGKEFPLQSAVIHDKIKETNQELYGVDYPLQSAVIQAKIDATIQEKYVMTRGEFIRHRVLEHGEEYRAKARQTCLERYGCEYPAQCEEIFHKMTTSGFARKEYVFPSGRLEYCQGDEPRCFDYMLWVENIPETSIEVGYRDRPPIWYTNPVTNSRSRYYPDGFLVDSNVIIEVKSVYWFEKDHAKNLAKFAAVNAMRLELWLYVFSASELAFKRVYRANGSEETNSECPPEPEQVAVLAGDWWEIVTAETGEQHVEIPLGSERVKIDTEFLPIVQREPWRLDTSTKIPQVRSKKCKRRQLHMETIATVGKLKGIKSLRSVLFLNGDPLDYRLCNLRRK